MSTLLKTGDEVALEISARMLAILVANGCETDIGLKVFRGRRKIDDSSVPCAVLVEGEDVIQANNRRSVEVQLMQRYVLIGYLACDPDNPNDAAHKIIRDLKRAIFRTNGAKDVTFGGKVRSIHYRGRDIGPRADGVAIVMAVIEIDVEFAEDLSNP